MNRFHQKLRSEMSHMSAVERAYGEWPESLADSLTQEEVEDAMEWLVTLERSKESVEEWDGDSLDDIWREQNRIMRLLTQACGRFIPQIAAGLVHPEPAVRSTMLFVVLAAPGRAFAQPLRQAMAMEPEPRFRDSYEQALHACLLEA